ncbi:hypothetical protein DIPPA_30008 [Diplonema papillatum]|nr:hypothetical protein DIPPA_30008 [Diplonema papillatum]
MDARAKRSPPRRPLYNVSPHKPLPTRRAAATKTPNTSGWSDQRDRSRTTTAAAAAAGRGAERVHLVNADALVSMVHELCGQMASLHRRVASLELAAPEAAPGGARARDEEVRALTIKLEAVAEAVRRRERESATARIETDLAVRDLRGKLVQATLLLQNGPAPPGSSPWHPTSASPYSTQPGLSPNRNPQFVGFSRDDNVINTDGDISNSNTNAGKEDRGGGGWKQAQSVATFCKLLQKDVLEITGEQARGRQALAEVDDKVRELKVAVEICRQEQRDLCGLVDKNADYLESEAPTGLAVAPGACPPGGGPLVLARGAGAAPPPEPKTLHELIFDEEVTPDAWGAGRPHRTAATATTASSGIADVSARLDAVEAILANDRKRAELLRSLEHKFAERNRERGTPEEKPLLGRLLENDRTLEGGGGGDPEFEQVLSIGVLSGGTCDQPHARAPGGAAAFQLDHEPEAAAEIARWQQQVAKRERRLGRRENELARRLASLGLADPSALDGGGGAARPTATSCTAASGTSKRRRQGGRPRRPPGGPRGNRYGAFFFFW